MYLLFRYISRIFATAARTPGIALYKTGTDTKDGNEVPEWLRYNDIMRRQVLEGRQSGQVSGYCFYDFSSLTRAGAAAEVANVTALFK